MENTNNGKAKIVNSMLGTEISIPSSKNWFVLLFGTAWLGGWYFGFKNGLSMLFFDGGPNGFIIFWLLAWSIGGIFVIGTLLWGYFGIEKMYLKKDKVELRKNVFGLGINKEFKKSDIKNVQFNNGKVAHSSKTNNFSVWGLGEGKIKFDYGMKTYSLGLGLDDAEANHLIELIKEKLALPK